MRLRLTGFLGLRAWMGISVAVCAVGMNASVAKADNEWANWRGPLYNGSSVDAHPPVEWSTTKNVQWKVEVPGRGSSTPIVWDNQVLVLAAEEATSSGSPSQEKEKPREGGGERRNPGNEGRGGGGRGGPGGGRQPSPPPTQAYRFLLISYDRATGKELWRTVATEQVPHEAGHNTNTFASSSAVTDGERIYAFFGSRGLFAYDMHGKKLWEKNFGKQTTRNQFGEGSTPALYRDTLIVPWDQETESFITALDAKTGETKWKVPRQERTSWATPVVVEHKGVTQVITNGTRVRSYDLKDGHLIWESGGQTDNPIPSPIIYGDYAIVMTGFRGAAAHAISLDSKGDITGDETQFLWQHNDSTPYVPSPVLYKDQIYFLKSNDNILTSLDVQTGKPVFEKKRLNDLRMVYSSLGAADDKIYITSREGKTVVLEHGPDAKVLATNDLEEVIDASPVFVGNQLFLRGEKTLYCIAEQSK